MPLFLTAYRSKQMPTPTGSQLPAADENLLYFKSDGLLYRIGSDGIERPVDTTGGYSAGSGLALSGGNVFSIAVGGVDSNMIANGAVAGVDIKDFTIPPRKMTWGQDGNYAANPGFETGATAPHGGTGLAIDTTIANIHSGTNALAVTMSATRAAGAYAYQLTVNGPRGTYDGAIPVQVGDVVHMEAWVKVGTHGTPFPIVVWYVDQLFNDGSIINNVQATPSVTTTGTYQVVSADY